MSLNLNNLRGTHKKYKTWPYEKKLAAVSQYLILGNMALVAASTGIGHELLREWKRQPWWADAEKEIRRNETLQMDDKLSKIVTRSLEAVQDRLDNGEVFYDQKTGKLKRKPVSMKDAAKVSVDLLSKRELLRGNATSRSEGPQVSVEEQLKMLAKEFAAMVNGKKPVETIEAEDADFREVEVVSGDGVSDEVLPDDQSGEGDEVAEEQETTSPESGRERGPDS